MQKKNKLRVLIILGALILLLGGWYLYHKYETEYINGVNPYQKEINQILGVNEPIFNSRSPKTALKPIYGMILGAYQDNTAEVINNIIIKNDMNKYNQYIETIKKNQTIMHKIFEFSNKNNIDYLNVSQVEDFYNTVQKIIDNKFNKKIVKEDNMILQKILNSPKNKSVLYEYTNNIKSNTKKYPDLKKDNYYSDCIWNNALIAFSYEGGGGTQIEFDTVNVE